MFGKVTCPQRSVPAQTNRIRVKCTVAITPASMVSAVPAKGCTGSQVDSVPVIIATRPSSHAMSSYTEPAFGSSVAASAKVVLCSAIGAASTRNMRPPIETPVSAVSITGLAVTRPTAVASAIGKPTALRARLHPSERRRARPSASAISAPLAMS